MPLYDYECTDCGAVREVQHSVNEIGKIQVLCEKCNSPMRKMISLPALIGFDEAGRSVGRKNQEGSTGSESSTGPDDSKKKEAKTEGAKEGVPKKESAKDAAA